MDAKKISQIALTLLIAKKRGAKLIGNSVFEKELKNWIDGPEIPLPVTSFGLIGDIPTPYEKTMNLQ